MRQLDDEGAARDVVQETFVRAWRAADRFDPSLASLRVWLFAIARNLVVGDRMGPDNGAPAGGRPGSLRASLHQPRPCRRHAIS
ncbi:sigma factor [Kribbella catacumbae]|uniref:sigma factor n=1 Tax=Kribbella catacumbae TaxID=460086 RepID=UPI001ED9BFA5|nr:sigma factor [Kribbella catacumbae]